MRFVFYALKESRTYVGQHSALALANKIHRPFPKLFRRFCAINLLTPGVLEFSIRLVYVGNQRLPGKRLENRDAGMHRKAAARSAFHKATCAARCLGVERRV